MLEKIILIYHFRFDSEYISVFLCCTPAVLFDLLTTDCHNHNKVGSIMILHNIIHTEKIFISIFECYTMNLSMG